MGGLCQETRAAETGPDGATVLHSPLLSVPHRACKLKH